MPEAAHKTFQRVQWALQRSLISHSGGWHVQCCVVNGPHGLMMSHPVRVAAGCAILNIYVASACLPNAGPSALATTSLGGQQAGRRRVGITHCGSTCPHPTNRAAGSAEQSNAFAKSRVCLTATWCLACLLHNITGCAGMCVHVLRCPCMQEARSCAWGCL
jgi:hypothetical protein